MQSVLRLFNYDFWSSTFTICNFTLKQAVSVALVSLPQTCAAILMSPVAPLSPQMGNSCFLSRILIITAAFSQGMLFPSPLPQNSGVTLCQWFLSFSNCHFIFLSERVFFPRCRVPCQFIEPMCWYPRPYSMETQEKKVDRSWEQRGNKCRVREHVSYISLELSQSMLFAYIILFL